MAVASDRSGLLPYRAVAFDFDGTLTAGGRPRLDVLEALASARRSGLRVVLACALGVAVANAVDALKQHADLVVDAADGAGSMAVLRDVVSPGCARRRVDRWSVPIGRDADGALVRVPLSDADDVVDHHCRHGDFSRWAGEALHDDALAVSLGEAEQAHRVSGDVARTRTRLAVAIERRYLS